MIYMYQNVARIPKLGCNIDAFSLYILILIRNWTLTKHRIRFLYEIFTLCFLHHKPTLHRHGHDRTDSVSLVCWIYWIFILKSILWAVYIYKTTKINCLPWTLSEGSPSKHENKYFSKFSRRPLTSYVPTWPVGCVLYVTASHNVVMTSCGDLLVHIVTPSRKYLWRKYRSFLIFSTICFVLTNILLNFGNLLFSQHITQCPGYINLL